MPALTIHSKVLIVGFSDRVVLAVLSKLVVLHRREISPYSTQIDELTAAALCDA
jgi:hypothetical protein